MTGDTSIVQPRRLLFVNYGTRGASIPTGGSSLYGQCRGRLTNFGAVDRSAQPPFVDIGCARSSPSGIDACSTEFVLAPVANRAPSVSARLPGGQSPCISTGPSRCTAGVSSARQVLSSSAYDEPWRWAGCRATGLIAVQSQCCGREPMRERQAAFQTNPKKNNLLPRRWASLRLRQPLHRHFGITSSRASRVIASPGSSTRMPSSGHSLSG